MDFWFLDSTQTPGQIYFRYGCRKGGVFLCNYKYGKNFFIQWSDWEMRNGGVMEEEMNHLDIWVSMTTWFWSFLSSKGREGDKGS